MYTKRMRRKALAAAFPLTLPILAGFWFLGLAYGISMNEAGFGFWYPMLMSLLIFGGSLEFVAISMLTGPFLPLQSLLMALLIQARHLFYGLAMLERYKGLGWKRVYLIFGMCDETFSINHSAVVPKDVDKGWFMLFVTLLNHLYWVSGATAGGLLGTVLPVKTEGIGFVMTAMFVVIFLEQWLRERTHATAWIGLGVSAACLLVFHADRFMIPAMACILLLLALCRRPIESAWGLE